MVTALLRFPMGSQLITIRRLAVAVCLLLFAFTGCGERPAGEGKPLIVGTEATFPPFEMSDDQGTITGFDIDLIEAIAEDQGFTIRLRDMAFDGIIPALATGQIDLAISAISITEDRRASVDFSEPYLNAGIVIAARTNDEIQTMDDLHGKIAAVQIGTTGATEAERLQHEGILKAVKSFPNVGLAIQDLLQGGVDIVINDKPSTANYVANFGGKVRLLEAELISDDYGIAVKKGNTELLERLNAGLANLRENGRLEEIREKYFPATSPALQVAPDDLTISPLPDPSARGVRSPVSQFFEVLPTLFRGAGITLLVCFCSELIGIIIGLSLALSRLFGGAMLRYPAIIYTDIIRGTPLLVQILFLYFGIPALINSLTGETFTFNPILAGILACGLNSGAYLGEIYRGAIKSIDPGQDEAARSLGMSAVQSFRHVLLPQALFRALPPMGNEFITLLKDTSLLSVIAVTEIVRVGQLYAARTYAIFPTYLAIAVTYFALVFIASRVLGRLEKKLGTHQ